MDSFRSVRRRTMAISRWRNTGPTNGAKGHPSCLPGSAVLTLVLLFFLPCGTIATSPLATSPEAGAINEIQTMPGHTVRNRVKSPLPYRLILPHELPESFSWGAVNGTSFLSKSLNQHLPHYCGSCWAHGALSSLADRIQIRHPTQARVSLSIQYILNCGSEIAGSCLGGTASGAFEFIYLNGFVPYETCQPYIACSADSPSMHDENSFCRHVDTTCSAINTCRTCEKRRTTVQDGEDEEGKDESLCREIPAPFPNATVEEYGVILNGNVHHIMAEIYLRGPVAAAVNGRALHDYQGGVFANDTASRDTTHVVSLVGWGKEEEEEGEKEGEEGTKATNKKTKERYWIARNSWGQYWGEMGFFRIEMGRNLLGIESEIAWGVPGHYS